MRKILLLLITLIAAKLQADELVLDTHTRAGALQVTITYETGRDGWAQYLASKIPDYMQAAETYFSRALPAPRALTIEGCLDCQSRLEYRHIFLKYDESKISNPSLLYHELTHLWLGYQWAPKCQEWLMEGGPSFLPLAMNSAGLLELSERDKREILILWGYRSQISQGLDDAPLCPNGWRETGLRYIKSFKIHKILYEKLGHKRYRNFIKSLPRAKPRNNTQALRLLKMYKAINWKRVLSGWVFGSRYRELSHDDFLSDSDSDALTDAEEDLLRTDESDSDSDNDTLPDGAEIELNRNPLRFDTDASSVTQTYGPFIDGDDSDWEALTYQYATDPALDSTGNTWTDLLGVKYMVKKQTLYLAVSTNARPTTASGIFFDVLIDSNSDYATDHEGALFFSSPVLPWHYNVAESSSEYVWNLRSASGKVIEMSFPLSLLGAEPSSINVLPIIRNDIAKLNLDQWDSWISVSLSASSR